MVEERAQAREDAGKRTLEQARSRTVFQAVCDTARNYPEKTALVAANDAGEIHRLAYAELVERVTRFSAGLASIGVRRGDRVVLWMTNTLEWIVSSFSCMRLGAAAVPVNTFLKPSEVKYVIAQSGARHLIMIDRFRKLDMPAMLAEICPAFASADNPGFLFDPDLPDLRNVVLFGRSGGRHKGAFDFAALEELGRRESRDLAKRMEAMTRPTDLGMVKYTSGSTGFPKGVMLEQGGLVASGVLHSRRIGVRDDDIFFSMMPFFHGGGSIYGQMTMLLNGGRLVFTEAFDPKLAVKLIDEEQATILFGVLAKEVVEAALAEGKVLGSLRYAHLPNADARRVMPNATFIFCPFGLTETYGPASITSPDDPPEKQNVTSGRLLEGNELRVVDPATGIDVEPGQTGEAWLKGNVMRGYWNKPEENARRFTEDGWLKSEDLVWVDPEDFIHYAGRIKLMLKVGGENVSIEEVEEVVESHEAVAQCAAVGVPDERKGEAVRIYVTARAGHTLTADELRPWLEGRLARFKLPREILFVEDLPRLANGKRDRVILSQWAKEEVAA